MASASASAGHFVACLLQLQCACMRYLGMLCSWTLHGILGGARGPFALRKGGPLAGLEIT
jgi:hypothetical protein